MVNKGLWRRRVLSVFVVVLIAACRHPPGSTEVASPPPSPPPVAASSPRSVSSPVSDIKLRRLLNELKDPDTYVRQEAARVLGEAGDPRAVEGLGKALKDKDDDVRAAAAEALGQIGAAAMSTVPDLLAVGSEDGNPEYRASAEAAVKALSRFGKSAVPELVKALEKKETLGAASDALARMGPVVIPALAAALRRGGNAAIGASFGAGNLGADGAPLVVALSEAFEQGKIDAWQFSNAIARIGPSATNAIPLLVRIVREQSVPSERDEALHALRGLGPGVTVALREALARESDSVARVRLEEALRGMPQAGH